MEGGSSVDIINSQNTVLTVFWMLNSREVKSLKDDIDTQFHGQSKKLQDELTRMTETIEGIKNSVSTLQSALSSTSGQGRSGDVDKKLQEIYSKVHTVEVSSWRVCFLLLESSLTCPPWLL
jgi:hypothetical protein